LGLLVFYRNRLLGRRSRLIEYKGAQEPAGMGAVAADEPTNPAAAPAGTTV
jgi:hypothetical protein